MGLTGAAASGQQGSQAADCKRRPKGKAIKALETLGFKVI
jgi:hypothetical protein